MKLNRLFKSKEGRRAGRELKSKQLHSRVVCCRRSPSHGEGRDPERKSTPSEVQTFRNEERERTKNENDLLDLAHGTGGKAEKEEKGKNEGREGKGEEWGMAHQRGQPKGDEQRKINLPICTRHVTPSLASFYGSKRK